MSKKYVYLFSEGNKDMRNLLGGKGANLAEMTHIGLTKKHPRCSHTLQTANTQTSVRMIISV